MNKNVITGTNSKIILIGKIKGLAQESKRSRKYLLNSKTIERASQCAHTKRVVGLSIRHHLLAYAFLSGKPYNKLEAKCAPGKEPNPHTILQVVHAHAPFYQVERGDFKLEHITAWLKGE